MALAVGCLQPASLGYDLKAAVEAGMSEVTLKSVSYSNASVLGFIPSGVSITATLTLINPKSTPVDYGLSWNLSAADFTVAPPASLGPTSATTVPFSFTLAAAAEHQTLTFSLTKTAPSTNRSYATDTLTVRCDSPPTAIPAIAAGNHLSIPYLEWGLPNTATDDDLVSAVVSWQDITHSATGSVTLSTSDSTHLGDCPAAASQLTATPRMHYELPQSTDTYVFTVKILDRVGQSSAVATAATGTASYQLVFDGNGQDSSWTAPATATYNFTDTVTLPTAPTKAGYTFLGWKDSASGTTLLPSATTFQASVWAASITLQAQWVAQGAASVTLTGGLLGTYTVSLYTDQSGSTLSTDSSGTYPVISGLNTSLAVNVTSEISPSASYTYQWLLDGAVLAGQSSSSVTLTAGTLSAGTHTLTFELKSGTDPWRSASIVLSAATVVTSIPTSGLVGEWLFSGGPQDTAGINPVTTVDATLTTDRFGRANSAYSLNGISSYLNAGNTTDVFTLGATYSLWVKLDQLPSTAGHFMSLAAKSMSGNDLDFQIETDNLLHFYAVSSVAGTTPLTTGLWYHVVATYAAGSAIKVYLNGNLEGTTTFSGTRTSNPNPLILGSNYLFSNRFLQGSLDDVRVYNRALSAAEVLALYHEGGY